MEDPIDLDCIDFVVQRDKSAVIHSQFPFSRTLLIFQEMKTYQTVGFRFSQNMENLFKLSSA